MTGLRTGSAVAAACTDKAQTRFRIAFERINSRGGCATVGDRVDYEVDVDTFVADIVSENPCSPKIKAAGSAAQGLLRCYARSTEKSEAVDRGALACTRESREGHRSHSGSLAPATVPSGPNAWAAVFANTRKSDYTPRRRFMHRDGTDSVRATYRP